LTIGRQRVESRVALRPTITLGAGPIGRGLSVERVEVIHYDLYQLMNFHSILTTDGKFCSGKREGDLRLQKQVIEEVEMGRMEEMSTWDNINEMSNFTSACSWKVLPSKLLK
jgi:hypothetical protein